MGLFTYSAQNNLTTHHVLTGRLLELCASVVLIFNQSDLSILFSAFIFYELHFWA